jgi:DUF971 family protein
VGEPTAEPLRIEVIESAELQIEWSDAVTTAMTSAQVRAACPCAGCRALPETERVPASYPDVTIDAVALVGSYAVSFVFGPDGHSAGIYSFSDLYAYRSV